MSEDLVFPQKRVLSFIPEYMGLFLVFILPLKFGGIVGLPEMPMTYWPEIIGIIVGAWPVNIFPVVAALTLIFTVLFAFPRKERKGYFSAGTLYAGLWMFLFLLAFPGMKNASTWDFVTSALPYFAGIGCFVLSMVLLLENDPSYWKKLSVTLGISFLFVLHCALNQYFFGFQEMEEFLAKQAEETGQELSLAFRRRFAEKRVTADFAAGNVFAGYLLLLFPMVTALLWKWGGRVTPPLLTRLFLTIPATGLFLFLLYSTRSRGCFLSLIAGLFFTLFALRPNKKFLLLLCSMAGAAFAGFILLIASDRGPRSIIFRLDYFQGALRLMAENPFWGAGWGEFFHDFHRIKLHFNDESPHSPHNFLLSLGSQAGFLPFLTGILLLLIPLAVAFLLVREEAGKREKGSLPAALVMKTALLASLSCWTFHAMGEIDLEVPGSLGCYIIFSLLAIQAFHREGLSLPFTTFAERKKWAWGILVFSLLAGGGALGCIGAISPKVIAGEIAFERLTALCNPAYKDPYTRAPATMEEILRAVEVCNKILPRSPFPWDRASTAAAMRGPEYANTAFALLEEARKRAPERGAYAYRLYLAMRKLGRKEEAEKYLEEAKKLSPRNINYYKYLPSQTEIDKMPSLW